MEQQPIFSAQKLMYRLSIIILLISLLSCSNITRNPISIEITSGSKNYSFDDINFCRDVKYLYFKVNKKIESDRLLELNVDKLFIQLNETAYEAKPLNIFSSNAPDSDLLFITMHDSNKLEYFQKDNDYWFILSASQENHPLLEFTTTICGWSKEK